MIEVVIKIPEEDWKFIKESDGCRYSRTIIEAVINGTPLPKHHGRIIDESKINKVFHYTEEAINNNIKCINTRITHTDAPTIIEGSDSE